MYGRDQTSTPAPADLTGSAWKHKESSKYAPTGQSNAGQIPEVLLWRTEQNAPESRLRAQWGAIRV